MSRNETKTLVGEAVRTPLGQVISGKFRITAEIGRGGMGIVYEAEDTALERAVALKFLPAELTGNPEARERFLHEARAVSRLDHPNICTVHEIGETEAGKMFIVMSRYKGVSLKDKLASGPLRPGEVVRIAVQIADGLAEAHARGIVHRDIKPGNIFVTDEGTVKILDFGLAKLADGLRLTSPGTTLGTAAYMSPEQARGDDVDARTDIWSLGIVLYEMVAGELPFRSGKDPAVIHAILHEPPTPVKELRAGFPAEMEALIARALAKDPGKRPVSAAEFAGALRALQEEMTTRTFPAARKLSFRRPRRRAMIVFAASALSLLAVVALIWLLNKPSLAFESRDKLMIADVENLTGDEVFDLALRTALELDLQQSPYATIFDKPQIAETLRLMRIDPAAKVDEETGCEICRFAGVRAFILPRIFSVGEAYEIQAILVDPVKRRHVDRFRVTALGREDVLLKAIDKLAQEVRSRLGESMSSIAKADKAITDVTTSSWEALNYFALGESKWQEGKFKEAAVLMELALEKDPQFVDARSSVGLLQIQFLGQPEKGREMLRQALADAQSQNLPERDILKLKAAVKQYVDADLPGALEEYGLITELFPDFMPAWNNSGVILRDLGRYPEAVAMFEKAAEIAPRNSIPLQNLWFIHMNRNKDAAAAEEAGRRMAALAPKLAYPASFLGYTLAVLGRFEEAESELRRAVEAEPEHPYAMANLAHVLNAQGKAAEAAPLYRRVVELTRQGKTRGSLEGDSLALIHALVRSGDPEAAENLASEVREAVTKRSDSGGMPISDLFVMGQLEAIFGRTDEAERYLKIILRKDPKDARSLMAIAELYALLGRHEAAIAYVRKSIDAGYLDFYFPTILPCFQAIRDDPEFLAIFGLSK